MSNFGLGTFTLGFELTPGVYTLVFVVSYVDADQSQLDGVHLWLCFSFKQAMEGPAAHLMREADTERLSEFTAQLCASHLPPNSPYEPFHYEGFESLIYRSLFRLLAQTLDEKRELAEASQKLSEQLRAVMARTRGGSLN